ncbi:MAG: dihydrodipicolinate synthase family protein [Clostridiales bacterium]|nr:dihydrodipicolinate synthase family protein [Clostridiales bacterium]
MATQPAMQGLFVAIVTPFTADNRVNEDAFRRLIERLIGQGAAGLLVAGSCGEFPMLTGRERSRTFELAARFCDQLALIANVSAPGVDEAAGLGLSAKAAGCHAIMATPPYYFRHDQAAIASFFRALRDAVDLPLYLYNFPINTGVELDLNHPAIRTLFVDGTLAGVKHTSTNIAQLERILSLNPVLRVFAGMEETYLAARAIGAVGAIGATFNVTLPLFARIEAAFSAGDLAAARIAQREAGDFCASLNHGDLFPAIKYALSRLGIDAGDCRRPFPTLSDARKAQLGALVAEKLA